jgi:serine/threonine protein kinase/PKD repeat protein
VGGEDPGNGDRTPAGVSAGTRIGGYRLEELVGAGGMSVVYRAVDERLGRQVALKVLTPELAADAALRARFIGESRAAAQVQDPHLIPVHEAGEAGGVLFIAMQYVAGGDVRSLLRRGGSLSPARTAAIVSAVASALDAAHAAGLVHRDVKPANMLLDVGQGRPDHVYLTDFGISRQTRAAGLTGAGQFLGTIEYAAPEQVRGGAVDGRADQYALACTAFELLTGQQPFARNEAAAVVWAQLTEPPPLLTPRRPDLPPAADGVLARALAKSPERRYATCREFADALRGALGLAPYDSVAPGIPRDGRGPAGRAAELATDSVADPSLATTRTRPPLRHRPPPGAPPVRPAPEPPSAPGAPPPRRRRWLLVWITAVVVAAGLAVGVHLATSGTKSPGSLGGASTAAVTSCRTPGGRAALSLRPAAIHETVVTITGVVTASRGTVLRALDWNWGDGTRQAGCALTRTHVYRSAGRHTVRVTATFSNGLKLHASEKVSLTPPLTTCPIPNGSAVLSLNPATTAGKTVTITGQLVAPRGTMLTDIDWNWGDGIAQSGCAYFPETHTYARAGRYTVVVTARFSNGSRKRATERVSARSPLIGPSPAPSSRPIPTASGHPAPSPSASPSPTVAPACQTTNGASSLSLFPATVSGLTVTINGVVIAPPGTTLTAIDWNWGDGTKLTGCAYFPETHDYASPGQYHVVVTATFSNGLQLAATETVSVAWPAT